MYSIYALSSVQAGALSLISIFSTEARQASLPDQAGRCSVFDLHLLQRTQWEGQDDRQVLHLSIVSWALWTDTNRFLQILARYPQLGREGQDDRKVLPLVGWLPRKV
jgi:hypothetical protein